jgi:hypothetical protein
MSLIGSLLLALADCGQCGGASKSLIVIVIGWLAFVQLEEALWGLLFIAVARVIESELVSLGRSWLLLDVLPLDPVEPPALLAEPVVLEVYVFHLPFRLLKLDDALLMKQTSILALLGTRGALDRVTLPELSYLAVAFGVEWWFAVDLEGSLLSLLLLDFLEFLLKLFIFLQVLVSEDLLHELLLCLDQLIHLVIAVSGSVCFEYARHPRELFPALDHSPLLWLIKVFSFPSVVAIVHTFFLFLFVILHLFLLWVDLLVMPSLDLMFVHCNPHLP